MNADNKPDILAATFSGGIVSTINLTSVSTSASPAGSTPSASDFTVALGASSGTVATGQSATTTVSMSFGAGFSQPVNFSCANLPANAACSFSPAAVTPTAGGAATTTLTITTGGGATAALPNSSRRSGSSSLAWLMGFGVLAGLRRPRKSTRAAWLFWGLAAVLASGFVAGCGGGGGDSGNSSAPPAVAVSTAPGTYTIGINASGGGVTKSTSYTLTVQ